MWQLYQFPLCPFSRKVRLLLAEGVARSCSVLIGQGANDPRVNIREADQMVQAMRAKGLEVAYYVYTDEGHGFSRPSNKLDFYGRVEEFLAKNLGGRAEPWKKIEGSSVEVR